jgi:hypothetical protein
VQEVNEAISFLNKKGPILLLLQTHCSENPIYVFPEKELHGVSPNFHIYVSVRFICPGSVNIFSRSRIGRPIVGIYKSLTAQTHECGNWD